MSERSMRKPLGEHPSSHAAAAESAPCESKAPAAQGTSGIPVPDPVSLADCCVRWALHYLDEGKLSDVREDLLRARRHLSAAAGIPVPRREVEAGAAEVRGVLSQLVRGTLRVEEIGPGSLAEDVLSAAAAVSQDPGWTEYRLKMEALLDWEESRAETWEGIATALYEGLRYSSGRLRPAQVAALRAFEAASVPLVAETEER